MPDPALLAQGMLHNDGAMTGTTGGRHHRSLEPENHAALEVEIEEDVALMRIQLPDEEKLVADAQMYLSKKAGRNTWSYLGRSASNLAKTASRSAV